MPLTMHIVTNNNIGGPQKLALAIGVVSLPELHHVLICIYVTIKIRLIYFILCYYIVTCK